MNDTIQLTVYPNPVTTVLTAKYIIQSDGVIDIEIYNLIGNRILTMVSDQHHYSGTYTRMVDVNSLPRGNYYLKLTLRKDSRRITKGLMVIKR